MTISPELLQRRRSPCCPLCLYTLWDSPLRDSTAARVTKRQTTEGAAPLSGALGCTWKTRRAQTLPRNGPLDVDELKDTAANEIPSNSLWMPLTFVTMGDKPVALHDVIWFCCSG